MKNDSKIWACLATGLITLLLSACCFNGSKKPAETAMLLDEEAAPAQHALVRLQERPLFLLDDRKRPFAMIDDRSDKVRPSDKPITIQESKLK